MPKLEQFEIKKYWQIFSGLKPVDNKLSHDQVLPILFNSKLDSSILNKIWFLADIDDDDMLDFEEFVICMRLIFDMVNKNIESIPDELPNWLIPGSKIDLIKERKASKQDSEKIESSNEVNEEKSIDWYISPSEKSLYDILYEQAITGTDGTVSFSSLSLVLKSKFPKMTSEDLKTIWNLVNPNKLNYIDKDPVLYFIHILKQKNEFNCELPNELPNALKDTFRKQKVSTNLNSYQANLKKNTPVIEKQRSYNKQGTDFSIIEGTDWEIVRLRRNLEKLENELFELTQNQSFVFNSKTKLLKTQFEQLLALKQKNIYNESKSSSINVNEISDDLNNMESQVSILQQYYVDKQDELNLLQKEIQSLTQ